LKPVFALEARPSDTIVPVLRSGWDGALPKATPDGNSKEWGVSYDPAEVAIVRNPPFQFHSLPQRLQRPRVGSGTTPFPGCLRRPHEPCPFDSEDFLTRREVARLERGQRIYALVCNRFPVAAVHFLAIRHPGADADSLPQYIREAEDLEDLLRLVGLLGPPWRCYFNSNLGSDGSSSGSSVNHWHLQFFPYFENSPSTLLTDGVKIEREVGGVRWGQVNGWAAHHCFLEGGRREIEAAAAGLWESIAVLNERGSAYNLEGVALEHGRFRLFLFPRRAAPPVAFGDAGELGCDMGGCELGGHFIIPNPTVFDWIRAHPKEALELSRKRLRESTGLVPPFRH